MTNRSNLRPRDFNAPQAATPAVRHFDVTCPGCGCVCDDLTVDVHGEQVKVLSTDCRLAKSWYEGLSNPLLRRGARVRRVEVSTEDAIIAAVAILDHANAPLIYGLSHSSSAGQRAATALADRIGSCIDTTASRCHAPSIVALQTVGESTSSLGEVRHRGDLIIFWGADPLKTHPRHWERYSRDPEGQFVPGGQGDRHVVVVDVTETESAAKADQFLRVQKGRDFEVLHAIRMLIAGKTPEGHDWGANRAEVEKLAQRMKACRSGTVFFGLGLTHGATAHRSVENLLRLVTELNRHTRFYARRMRLAGDVAGADSVLTWQTGYPFSVSLGRGWPRYNHGEFSANELLECEEVDACLLVGGETVLTLSAKAQAFLQQIPTIVLSPQNEVHPFPGTVEFTTAVYGVHHAGTAYRMDEVPIPLPKIMDSQLPSDAQILEALTQRAQYRGGWSDGGRRIVGGVNV